QAHWLIPVLILGAGVPILHLLNQHNVDRYALGSRNTSKVRLLSYLRGILTGRQAAKEVRLFGLGSTLTNKWTALHHELMEEALHQRASLLGRRAIVEALPILTFGLSLYLVVSAVSARQIGV